MKTMRKGIIACLCLLAAFKASAQSDFNRIVLSATAESALGKGAGYAIGVGYILPVKGVNNVGFGLYYDQVKHTLTSEEFSYAYNTVDDEGDEVTYKAYGQSVKEKQRFNLLEIPVYYQFRATNIFVNIGPEVVIPISAEYNTTEGNVTLSGYYPQYNVELKDLPQHGFGEYDITGNHGTLETRVTWGVNASVGYCYSLGNVDINVSAYTKFLMNGYVKEKTNYLEYPEQTRSLSYVESKKHLCSFGLSVGIGL